MVLDEATSALPLPAERMVYEQLLRVKLVHFEAKVML